jgi:hypothetical protein
LLSACFAIRPFKVAPPPEAEAEQLTVTLSPPSATIVAGDDVQLNAAVTSTRVDTTTPLTVTWSVLEGRTAGTVRSGRFRAALTPGIYTVRAASSAQPEIFAEAKITVQAFTGNAVSGVVEGDALSEDKRIFLETNCAAPCDARNDYPFAYAGTAIDEPGPFILRGVSAPTGCQCTVSAFVGNRDQGSRRFPWRARGTSSSFSVSDNVSANVGTLVLANPPEALDPRLSATSQSAGVAASNFALLVVVQGEMSDMRADSVEFFVSTTQGFDPAVVASRIAPILPPGTSAIVLNEASGTTVYYRYRPLLEGLAGELSAEQSFTINPPSQSGSSTLKAALLWSEASPQATVFIGAILDDSLIVYGSVRSVAIGRNSYEITGLPAGTYKTFAAIDRDQDGVIDAGELIDGDDKVTVTNGETRSLRAIDARFGLDLTLVTDLTVSLDPGTERRTYWQVRTNIGPGEALPERAYVLGDGVFAPTRFDIGSSPDNTQSRTFARGRSYLEEAPPTLVNIRVGDSLHRVTTTSFDVTESLLDGVDPVITKTAPGGLGTWPSKVTIGLSLAALARCTSLDVSITETTSGLVFAKREGLSCSALLELSEPEPSSPPAGYSPGFLAFSVAVDMRDERRNVLRATRFFSE